MTAVELTTEQIKVFNPDLPDEQAEILVRDGLALAQRIAPCITDDDFEFPEAAAAIIRGAVLRWADSGSGALSSEQSSAGPFSQTQTYDTRQARRSLFFPSEISELQKLCRANVGGAFSIDTIAHRRRGCTRDPVGCPYLLGSLSSPCQTCGEVLRPGVWEGR